MYLSGTDRLGIELHRRCRQKLRGGCDAHQDLPEGVLDCRDCAARLLYRGAARIEGTAAFGEGGNVGLAAHRDGYFRALQGIRKGDLVEVLTMGERLRYRVSDIRIVSPQFIEVLAPTEAPALTLVTCYPFRQVGPGPQRFIVRATGLP
jgi:LPXTG-site transpeptidase (sortase) family protein